MSHDVTPGVATAVAQPVIIQIAFVELDYPTGKVRVNSTDRELTIDVDGNPEIFLGVGQLGSIEGIDEPSDLQASVVNLTLSGVSQQNVSAAFEKAQGRPGKIWIAYMDDNYVIIPSPVLIFQGLMDSAEIEQQEDGTATVSIPLNNRFIEWTRPRIARYSPEELKATSGDDDTLFDRLDQATSKELVWGTATPFPVNPAPDNTAGG